MRVLFAHQNFPGQYRHLLTHFAADPANEIVFLTRNAHAPFPGIKKIVYQTRREPATGTHHYVRPLERAVLYGQEVARVALGLKEKGFVPDIMIGHNAWGETLYLKDVYPDAPLLSYFEFFYSGHGLDVDFDPEFPTTIDTRMRVRTLNAINLFGLHVADRGQTATEWQRGTYPARYRDMISVVHEGVDTEVVKPDPKAVLKLNGGLSLSQSDEVVTYISRKLEPYRGFHIFMRALPEILKRRPKAHAVIVGADGKGYGHDYPKGGTWRQAMLDEVDGKLDASRVHFLGQVRYETYLKVLQVSSAHIYLTYPFVLSWSMLEAMAAGCLVIGSATPPVKEVIRDGENGLLVDFFDTEAIAEKVESALAGPSHMEPLRVSARRTIVAKYDCASVCLPQQLQLIEGLVCGAPGQARLEIARSCLASQALQTRLTAGLARDAYRMNGV